jgi:predicted  nucleic acid-binding Zn-ribbon protein
MNQQKLKKFIELVTFDQQFIDLTHKIASEHAVHAKIIQQMGFLDQELESQKSRQREIIKHLHDHELKLKELGDEESRLAVSAQAVHNTKEFDAVNRELESLKLVRTQQEQRVIQSTNKVAHVAKEVEAFQAKYQTDKEQLQEQIKMHDQTMQQVQAELESLQAARAHKLQDIPEEWLKTYEQMRGRVKNPVVAVEGESCSACFYFMSSRDVQILKNQGLSQCKDCYRFLYFESPNAGN